MCSRLAAVWGVMGVCALLMFAVMRLMTHVIAMWSMPLSTLQWVLMTTFLVFMLYTEGYRGFQKSFSPRVVARAQYLSQHSNPVWIVFAPLFCMSYFAAPKQRIVVSIVLTLAIVSLVVGMRYIPQPWRGMIDLGVVCGLSWGMLSLLYCSWQAVSGKLTADPQVQ